MKPDRERELLSEWARESILDLVGWQWRLKALSNQMATENVDRARKKYLDYADKTVMLAMDMRKHLEEVPTSEELERED